MKIKKVVIYLGIFFACFNIYIAKSVVQLPQGPEIYSKAFDRATGTLYIGYNGGIDSIPRYDGRSASPESSPVVSAALTKTEFLTLATKTGSQNPLLPYVLQLQNTNPKEAIVVNATNKDGEINYTFIPPYPTPFVPALLDASGGVNVDGQPTEGIVGLAASENFIFAAVRPNAGDFGGLNSGIAVVEIDKNNQTLVQTAAVANDTGIKAQKVDTTTSQLQINGNIAINTADNTCSLHWDDKLQRLYIGISQIQPVGNNGARSIIVANVDCNGILYFQKIAPNAAFNAAPPNNTEIIGNLNPVQPNISIGVYNLRTMHTSTGKDYLIVNGGNATPGGNVIPKNTIYALPLWTDGTLALKNFAGPIIGGNQLTKSTDRQAQVGQRPLPLATTDPISDIVVVGDTVYVAINDDQNTNNNEAGVLYSQAMFDERGIIYSWTPWTKRAFPFKAFLDIQGNNGKIKFFDVDAYNGKIWAITAGETPPQDLVATTAWTTTGTTGTTAPNALVYKLNQDLPQGCFSVLDLDQSTVALGQYSPARYALFGGFEKVVFAKISRSYAQVPNPDPNYRFNPTTGGEWPQEVITRFSCPQNYKVTTLPQCSGRVNVMEFSRRLPALINEEYFFAGTDNGLYVFADDRGQGFTVDQAVDNLNTAPFNGLWQKAPNIPGTVIDIKTSGAALYILTYQTNPLKHVVYRVDFTADINTMFATPYKIAESSTFVTNSDLSNTHAFFGMQIMQRNINGNIQEQLTLVTNYGVFISGAILGIHTATNQLLALWEPVDPTDTAMYNNIFGVDAQFNTIVNLLAFPSTVWPIKVVTEGKCETYEKNEVTQLSGAYNLQPAPPALPTNKPTFNPLNYKRFTLDPIVHFWTDGARRVFSAKRTLYPTNESKLFVIPYATNVWNVTKPSNQMLEDTALQDQNYFYWTKQIGISGLFMAGTDKGVVSLE